MNEEKLSRKFQSTWYSYPNRNSWYCFINTTGLLSEEEFMQLMNLGVNGKNIDSTFTACAISRDTVKKLTCLDFVHSLEINNNVPRISED
jgi:hypothetical protein